MNRRPNRGGRLARYIGDPLINGVVTLVVVLGVVYVSYTANNGIPFVPKYRVQVDVPTAAQLVRHAEVRVGGARVGQVLKISPVLATRTEPAHARLDLALKNDLGPLPIDTTSEVRVASILGGKYVGLTPGKSTTKLAHGQVLPLRNATSVVDLDEAFRVFTPPTQQAVRDTVHELGDALAGRGADFNNALGELAVASRPLPRVLRLLAAPSTNLGGFIAATATAIRTLAPLTDGFIAALRDGATTLQAINAAGPALGSALDALPSATSQTTTTLVHLQPALRAAATITHDLAPGTRQLPSTIASLDATLRAATPVARDIRTLAAPLNKAFKAVIAFSGDKLAIEAFKLLGSNDLATFGSSGFVGLGGIFSVLAPAQLNCNVFGIYANNLSSAVSEGDAQGAWLPLLATPAYIFGATPLARRSATLDPQLHVNPYPHENADECEAGNNPRVDGIAVGNPPGNQPHTAPMTAPPPGVTARARAAGLLEAEPR